MMVRRLLRSLAMAVALMIWAPAMAQGQIAQTMSLLSKPITMQVQDARFEDIVDFVRTTTGATIDIAWISDRHSDGLDPDALVSLDVKNAQALALLLHAAKQAAPDDLEGPTWQLDHRTGAIQIGPRSRLNKFKRLEIYDIHDLILVLPDYRDVPRLNLNSVLRQGQGSGGGTGIFQQTQNQRSDADPRLEAERIIEILEAVVEPDQWIDNGGDGATVRFYEGNLLVSAPDYIHRQINGYAFLAGPIGRPPLAGAEAPDDMPKEQARAEQSDKDHAEASSGADQSP